MNSYKSKGRSKSANDITKYIVNSRIKDVDKINVNDDSISIMKSSEFGTVSNINIISSNHQISIFHC